MVALCALLSAVTTVQAALTLDINSPGADYQLGWWTHKKMLMRGGQTQ